MAFSPTDTMPLTNRVKGLMAIESLISLAVIGLAVTGDQRLAAVNARPTRLLPCCPSAEHG